MKSRWTVPADAGNVLRPTYPPFRRSLGDALVLLAPVTVGIGIDLYVASRSVEHVHYGCAFFGS